jgi:hypothetical protein
MIAFGLKKQLKKLKHLLVVNKEQLLNKEEEELFIVTKGGLVTDKQQNVVWPGDVIDGKTLHRLVKSFDIQRYTTVIHITK